jgi:4-hydroxybenzoate polyprenyltransferase
MAGFPVTFSSFRSYCRGGYIINDYFDINIDQVNKPKGNVVDTVVSRRWQWHGILFLVVLVLY